MGRCCLTWNDGRDVMGWGDFESIHKPGAKRILLQSLRAASTWQQRQRAWELLDARLRPDLNAWLDRPKTLAGRWRVRAGAGLDLSGRRCAVLCHVAGAGRPVSTARQVRLLRELGLAVLAVGGSETDAGCDGSLALDFAARRLPAWKAAFEAWPSLAQASEVTLCDDTVLAPGTYEPMYRDMEKVRCDMWGAALNFCGAPCLHPAHLVLRPAALAHEGRARFFAAVDAVDDDAVLDGWDEAFSLWMEMSGLGLGCYRTWDTAKHWEKAVRDGVPCLEHDCLARIGADGAALEKALARAGWSAEEVAALSGPAR